MNTKKLIWDIPTRIFHWLLVVSILSQWITAEWLEDAMDWHFYIGYFTLGLILFRIVWGFVGPHYARFSTQLSSINQIMQYGAAVRAGKRPHYTGHNPVGAWFLPVILVLVMLQAVSGLFITDDIFATGPYYSSVSEQIQGSMSWIHHNIINVIWLLVGLHIAAIVVHQGVWKEYLVLAMIHGKKPVTNTTDKGISSSKISLALLIVSICGLLVYLLISQAPEVESYYY